MIVFVEFASDSSAAQLAQRMSSDLAAERIRISPVHLSSFITRSAWINGAERVVPLSLAAASVLVPSVRCHD
ncbi:hypothetical protein [Amycolatopsis sp. MtRt-6]|uniref:hypothetical protein n=1 Tax=Amycolatopsis sp. MtRt-6 TaxID=2792782 RepID=UPI001A900779|nr:hypothetical protein [Amycolatopsis sp. MtRt-6]